jgi:hypothetical protein
MRKLIRRLWYLARRRQWEADLVEEIDFHRALKQRELEDRGADPTDAAIATRRALGNTLLATDRARDVWIWPWLQDVSQDVRFAGRLLTKDRAFTTVAVFALGLGSA